MTVSMNMVPGNPAISVVMGSYNAAPWIDAAIQSVLAQTFPVAEVIVVDDGSTDQTPAIVKSYGGPVRLVQEQHRGRPHRNRGIALSRGDLIAFLDADDYWHPTKVERQLERLRDRSAEWVICEADWLDAATGRRESPADRQMAEGDILARLFVRNFIVASTPLITRRVLTAVGGFDESADVAPVEDWDLWLRIAEKYPLACVWEALATVRLHGDSFLASTPLTRRVRSLEYVIHHAAEREPSRLGPRRALALHNVYYSAGVAAFRQDLTAEARSYFYRAWRERPTDMAALAYLVLLLLPNWASGALRSAGRKFRHKH